MSPPSRAAVFRRYHEAWTEGDVPGVLEQVDPDIVARPLHGALFTKQEFRGHDGITQWYREMTDPWDRFEATVDDVCETPDGVLGTLTVVGYRDEQGFHARVGVQCTFHDGRIATLTARNVGDVEKEIAATRT
jgi:ketosteroid isomerase-like protein